MEEEKKEAPAEAKEPEEGVKDAQAGDGAAASGGAADGSVPSPDGEGGETAAGGDAAAAAEKDAAKQPSEEAAEEKKPAEPDWKDMYARLLADFDNFKKRTARDREDTYRFAEADILKDVLPAVDNLALALDKAEDKENAFVKGVQLAYDSLLKSLKEQHGAEPFDSVGKELDTEKMNAIATLPSEDVEEGKVSIESKKGWMLRDKVLRAADVVVSSGKANNG